MPAVVTTRHDHIRGWRNVVAKVIDLHTHVLPGIDDGPATVEDALELARAAAAAGTEVLVATPHVNWRYRNQAQPIAQAVAELNEQIAAAQIETPAGTPLGVRAGAEIALTAIEELDDGELAALSLGGGPWLLVEPPFAPVVANLDGMLRELQARGHRLVLAHPERCAALQRDWGMLQRIVAGGVLTSVTASSLTGRFGGEARKLAHALAREGMLHNVASDTHDVHGRPPAIAAELQQAGLASLAQWLTVEVPQAILAGGEIPPRPEGEAADGERAEADGPGRRRSRWRVLHR